ncbi:hypothetical protein FIBSPDRAFT_1047048 [Athelia psychrophila]|uniref:USP8 dimerisation domain-containing protein n=1 Tax=Athelia psychrophila TaxID=1759441 RepID=A0A166FRH8_9AGAM|nr:hypothetical protein FIBSPDRAFT_1047048 [Fibularhizoctonia sp. CBS 109695]
MLSRPFSKIVHNVMALAVNQGTKETNQIKHADKYMERAKFVSGSNIERAFVDYAAAAVILRAKLSSRPGDLEQSSVASKLQESCRYIRLFEKYLINGNIRYHGVAENRLARDRQDTQDSWRSLRDLTGFDDGAEGEEDSSRAIQMPSDSDAGNVIGHKNLATASRSSSPAALLPPERASMPERPPSPLSHWIELHPVDSYEHDIPEAAPEHTSLYIDLHSIEDDARLIPEVPPEPRSMWVELHSVDGNERSIPEVAPEPTSLYLDLHPLEDDEDSVPEDLPDPQSYWMDLHPIDQSARPVPETSPEPVSMSLDLHPSEDAS